ncbi:hypothetical protein LTR50_007834 [Elasticomyces elasticus]|nr:hypothetical protein LTR50_007834 [Elasticomyces elasticus]
MHRDAAKGKSRGSTPYDFADVKSVRYDDAKPGKPPTPVSAIFHSQPPSHASLPSSSPPRTAASLAARSDGPPGSSPQNVFARTSHLSHETKRDSGIEPSAKTTTAASADERVSYAESGLSRNPSVPAIVVQDATPDVVERSRSPFGRRKVREAGSYADHSSAASRTVGDRGGGAAGVSRMPSFKAITTDIPTGSFGDFTAGDQLSFSKRGSMLFGGRKMNQMIGEGANGDAVQEEGGAQAQSHKGLVSGRRKPSVQMLQAAIQGGRVLSAEEITFSMKVRSMYDRGDEGAADWVNGQDTPHLPQQEEDRGTPDMQQSKLQVGERQTVEGNAISRCASAASMREGRIVREPYELAGGIEDWENINGQEVDRYGFILPRKAPSRGYQNSPVPSESQRIPRVSTSLQVASESPRGKRALHRKPSDTRSTRSTITPRRTSDAGTGPPASLYSYQSANSNGFASNPFKSRDRRCMDEASDMLTLPPGLADVAEQEDGGRTANLMKQREWAREEKWRKMARLVHKGHRGEGMYFTFDTQDPKVVARTWKGIPDRWRATAWHAFLTDSAARRGGHASDEQLIDVFHQLQERSSADDVQIDVDVPRTINMHIMFRRRYRGGQRLLFRVLHAISLHCPEPGYVQGMAALAATLLCYYDEERAFVMLVRLWQLRGLEQLYRAGFGGLMAALDEFEQDWLRGGEVARKLQLLAVSATAYGTRWYLTLFNMSIPFPAQLRVWDVFMLLGDAAASSTGAPAQTPFGGAELDVLHATSAALMDATRDIILDSDFENAMKVLTSWIPIRDEDFLMRVVKAEWKMRKRRGEGAVGA